MKFNPTESLDIGMCNNVTTCGVLVSEDGAAICISVCR